MLRNSAFAISRLPLPAAARAQIWRWRGVSAAAPSIAAWRGRRPVATSSRRARRVGRGQRRAQLLARLDAGAEAGERGAELEPYADRVERAARERQRTPA